MSATSRVAGAVAAGYALGRFKKLRLAVLVATAMSSPKFRNAAVGMIQDRIPGGTVVGPLTKEVGGKLVNVGKTAATSIVASRIDTLSQSLAERSQNLRKGAPGGQAGKSRADEAEDDREAEQPEDEYEEQEGEEAEEPTDEYEEQEDEEAEEPDRRVRRARGRGSRRARQTSTKSKRARKPKSPQTSTKSKRARKPKSPQTSTKSKRARKPKSPQTSTKSKRARKPKSPQTSPKSKRHPETRSPKNQ